LDNRMEICVYCGKPIEELPYIDGVPLHAACINSWCVQENVDGIITSIYPANIDFEQIEREEKFTRDLLVGSFFKNLAVTVLHNAGYEVYPFGYESFLAGLKRPLYDVEPLRTETAERIRSAPDIVVLDRETSDLYLVEVKFRGRLWDDQHADIYVNLYRKYWNESVLILICPRGKIFYAQFVKNLTRTDNKFPVSEDFLPLEDIFTRISWEHPVTKGFYTRLVRAVSENLSYKKE
jgi:hypothetical protein